MARKTAVYKVKHEGRDKGKQFLLTEMDAEQGEAWAIRVLLALMASNVSLPDGFENLGMAAVAQMGLQAISGLKWEVAKPLLDEMFGCIEITPDPKKTHVHRALLSEPADIEEIRTRFDLRIEVWQLHMGFLTAVLPSLKSRVKAPAGTDSHTEESPE